MDGVLTIGETGSIAGCAGIPESQPVMLVGLFTSAPICAAASAALPARKTATAKPIGFFIISLLE
jgi:hypothetical protein